jgi:hypothetical protein
MEGVSLAWESELHDLALEWLEQGRSIVWGQILQLRSPVKALEATNPDLAIVFTECSDALEKAATAWHDESDTSLEAAAQAHRRLAEKREELLKRIRAIQGFNDFLKPKKSVDLKHAALDGIVVVVNMSRYGCDAFILQPDLRPVSRVRLDSLSHEKLDSARDRLHKALYGSGVRMRDGDHERQSISRKSMGGALPNILRMLWLDVAKPIVNHLGYTVGFSTCVKLSVNYN